MLCHNSGPPGSLGKTHSADSAIRDHSDWRMDSCRQHHSDWIASRIHIVFVLSLSPLLFLSLPLFLHLYKHIYIYIMYIYTGREEKERARHIKTYSRASGQGSLGPHNRVIRASSVSANRRPYTYIYIYVYIVRGSVYDQSNVAGQVRSTL